MFHDIATFWSLSDSLIGFHGGSLEDDFQTIGEIGSSAHIIGQWSEDIIATMPNSMPCDFTPFRDQPGLRFRGSLAHECAAAMLGYLHDFVVAGNSPDRARPLWFQITRRVSTQQNGHASRP